MGIFEQFPYTNFHDLNLDWILHAIQSMDKKLDEFVASNVLSYADPIQWDIETQYAKNTVVIDPKTGTAYMSINPVPVGQLLTNKYYWQPIFNYDEIVNTLKKQIAAVQADQHDTTLVAVGRGSLVWVANKLYRLTKSLDAGSKIIENENAVPVTVEDAIINIDTTKNITRNTDGTITDTAGTITRNSDNIIDTANDAISVSGKTITNVAADSITNSSTNITDTASAGISRNAATITDTASAGISRNAATITDTASGDVTVSGENITDTASAGIARNAVTITDTATGDVSVSGGNITETASAGISRDAVNITDTATGDVSVSGGNITETASAGISRDAVNITDTATGDITVNGRNIVNAAPNNITFNVDGILDFNTKNPIKYSTPQALNHYFKYIPATDRTGNEYKILVDNGAVFGRDFFSGIVIGCGDSIARGYPLSTNDGTLNKIAEKTGKTINTDFYNVAEDATGYTSLNEKITFRQQIEKLNSVITDKSNVTGIIVIGGTNDYGANVETTAFANAIDDFITYSHSTYPNAKIAIVSNFMSNNNIGSGLKVSEYLHVLQTVKYPAYHVANLGVALKKWYLATEDTQSDAIHPNAKGYDLAATFIINKIMGGVTEDYTFIRLSTRKNWDSCYLINGDQFIFQFFNSDHFGNTDYTNTPNGNNSIMCNFNFGLKMRTVGLGGESLQPWVTSLDTFAYVMFDTTASGWVNCFSPTMVKYFLGNNGKIYTWVAGVDTKNAAGGFINSNTIKEMWCSPWIEGNLNHITLLV